MRILYAYKYGKRIMAVAQPLKKPTNLSLSAELLADARELNINLSKAAEAGLRQHIARARSERWKAENKSAMKSSNQWVEDHGLPLDRHRQF
jgi:antitoxin CcdA